jgi:RNA polymerase sigma factor (sigma-70 family)
MWLNVVFHSRKGGRLSDDGVVERCVEVLLEDAERIGPLSLAHVTGVAERRGLNAAQLVDVRRALALLEVLQTDIQESGTSGRIDEGKPGDDVAGWVAAPTMPARLGKHTVLTAQEEVSLARRIQMGLKAEATTTSGETSAELSDLISDGLAAKRELVSHNMRLAMKTVQGYVAPGSKTYVGDLTHEDLVQEASFGLNRAAEKFDPTLGYKFSTYATWWIKQSVTRAIENTATTVRLPTHVWTEWRQVDQYARGFEIRNGRPPTLGELAEATGKDPGHLRALFDWTASVVRLDTPVGGGDGSSSLGDLILRNPSKQADERILRDILQRQIRDRIEQIAEKYDPRFKAILVGRFGLDGSNEMTLEQLGKEFGITRERVRQLEKKILNVLRDDEVLRQLGHDFLEVA